MSLLMSRRCSGLRFYESKMADKRKENVVTENQEFQAKKNRVDTNYNSGTHSNASTQNQQAENPSCSNPICEHRGNWMSLYDATSGYFYYQNTKSYQTQWEKPANWNNLPPVFNPWVKMKQSQTAVQVPTTNSEPTNEEKERGMSSKDIEDKLSTLLKRPARQQIDADEKKKEHWIPEGATEYNIWYDRWVGEHWRPDDGPAETRCCLDDDAGYTKANVLDPKTSKHYYCLFFSKGSCHLGQECGYLHSLPTDRDEKRIGLSIDCFGRERHLNHKENLGGVGSFEKDCTTLYVGGLSNRRAVEEQLWEEFGEWGEIEDIRVIQRLNIAFVRYKNRVNAEFAKVAMADQKLGNRDLLNVRWATDDPNPRACKQELEKAKDKLVQAAYDRGIIQELQSQDQPIHGNVGDVTALYPNTDSQYAGAEYWSWYMKTTDNAENRPEHYPLQAEPAQHTEQGPITQEEVEQNQVYQNVFEDCSRLDKIFKQMESKDNNQGASSASCDSLPSRNITGTMSGESNNTNEHYKDSITNQFTDSSTVLSNTQAGVASKDPYRG